ncbi:MAG: TraB/GumN family protein [Desulfatirhabdiaceae bacterium]
MQENGSAGMIHRLMLLDKEVVLVGTAHVSKSSRELVQDVIEQEKPDTVCVELCQSRYQAIKNKEQWQEMDIVKVIRENKTFLLMSSLIMSSFQRRIAKNLDIQPGAEMIQAMESAELIGARICLVDRDVKITLSRAWRTMSLWGKTRFLSQLIASLMAADDISEEEIERIKQQDVMDSLMADMGKYHPDLKRILIDERDEYLAHKIVHAEGKKIVAVVGAGHVPGIRANWGRDIDIQSLETLPSAGKLAGYMGWGLCILVVAMFIAGFYQGGMSAGTEMLTRWALVTGALAGLGAAAAFGHPLTILSSVLAAPLTTLHPLIAVGWVAGLVEAFSRKPRVKDIEDLPNDILSVRGFWKNKVTRILLVVIFSNIGGSIGTFIAIPMMVKMMA